MQGKKILIGGLFLFCLGLMFTLVNLSRSGLLAIFFSNEGAGIGSIGGSLSSLILLFLMVFSLIIGVFLMVIGVVKLLKKTPLR